MDPAEQHYQYYQLIETGMKPGGLRINAGCEDAGIESGQFINPDEPLINALGIMYDSYLS